MSYVNQVPKMGRKIRRPVIEFNLETRPWQIQPFVCAPVLPGETMKNLKFQSRVVSDPVKNPLIGWHKEYHFFYVKLRDMVGAADFEEMMLDPAKDMSSYNSAADVKYFHSYGINWAKMALDVVVKEYFRADDEAANQLIDGLPVVSLNKTNAIDSALTDTDYSPPGDVDVDANADGTITIQEIDQARSVYEMAYSAGITDMDFNDYLKTFGIRIPNAEQHRPELIRSVKEWTYPSNTVDPTSGAPSSALSWSIADRADKDRMFKEPGFILGITVSRPKVYLGNYKGTAVGLLNDAFSWLPATLRGDVQSSWKEVATATKNNGPLTNQTEGYWFDMADLFMHGEQFMNFALTEPGKAIIAMPTAGLEKRYATATMADLMFNSASPKNKIKEDGRLDLNIASSLRDNSPAVSRSMV